MKHLLLVCFIIYSGGVFSQNKELYGIYFSRSVDFSGTKTIFLRLGANNNFGYYENKDEGDLTFEALSSGKYSIVNDSLLFEATYDPAFNIGNVKSPDFVDYSGFKFKVFNKMLRPIALPGSFAQTGKDTNYLQKFDFSKMDSLKAVVHRSDDISSIEDVIITKDGKVKISFNRHFKIDKSNSDGNRMYYLDNDKYKSLVSELSATNFFSLYKINRQKNIVFGCLDLFYGGNKLSVCGNYFSPELYELLFEKIVIH